MIGMKHGQGAAKAAPEPTLSPERRALADALAALEQRQEYLARARDAKEANGWEARSRFWSEKDEAQKTLRNLPKLREDYFSAVARGEPAEKPPAEHDLRAVIVRCEQEIADGQELEKAQDKAIEDLQQSVRIAEMNVKDAALEVMRADPVGTQIVEECQRAWLRYMFLNRAVKAFSKHMGELPVDNHRVPAFPTMPPCPYARAGEALVASSHASIPALDEALKAI
jgi:hypothetical protein